LKFTAGRIAQWQIGISIQAKLVSGKRDTGMRLMCDKAMRYAKPCPNEAVQHRKTLLLILEMLKLKK
jgi:hypothetical protein